MIKMSEYQNFSLGMQRVGAVFNPFNWQKIDLVNPFNQKIIADVTIPTKIITIGAEAGALAYGGALALGGASATGGNIVTGTAIGASTHTVASGISLKTAGILTGAGVVGGLLLGQGQGIKQAPQTQSNQQQSNPVTPSNQTTNNISNQTTTNNANNYGSGSQYFSPTNPNTNNPSTNLTPNIKTGLTSGQDATQQASSGISTTMIIIGAVALIGFLYFTKGGK